MRARAREQARRIRLQASGVAGVPPGDYHVIAVDDLPEEEALTNVTSADFLLDLIPRARRVRLPPSRRVQVELPLRSTR